nr:tetratricopeptide repeat protein [Streptomyces specialis]
MGFDPSYVSHIESCRQAPSAQFARLADQVLNSNGILIDRWQVYHTTRSAASRGLRRLDFSSDVPADDEKGGSTWDRRGSAAPSSRNVPRQLPPLVHGFAGRLGELEELDQYLPGSGGGSTLRSVLLCGPPGVGKTALAIQWAHQVRDFFTDGHLYADLRGFDLMQPISIAEVFDSFLRALGVPPKEMPGNLNSQESLFRSLAAGRKLLIILDNATSAESIRPFLSNASGTLLITSRNRLSGLSARDGVRLMQVDILPHADSLTLLANAVGRDAVRAELAVADKLVSVCGHLPISLRIVAEQIASRPQLSLRRHLEALSEEGSLLENLTLGDDDRTNITAIFSWSYRKLDYPTSRLFRLLAAAPGWAFKAPAIAALCGTEIRTVRKMLQTLVHSHLMQEMAGEFFGFHDLLRSYGCSLAESSGHMNEKDQAIRQLIHWYAASAENASKFLTPGGVRREDVEAFQAEGENFASFDEALHWFDEERRNLIDIVRRATEIGELRPAAVIPDLMWSYFNLTKHWSDWIECNNLGLEAARAADDARSEAYLLMSQGVVHLNLQRIEEAVRYQASAVQLFEETGDLLGLAYALQNLANAESAAGSPDSALNHFERALSIFHSLPDGRRGRAVTLTSMAALLNAEGRYEEAAEIAVEARTIAHAIADARGEAISLSIVAFAYSRLSQGDEAIDFYQQALRLRSQISDQYGRARILHSIGNLYRERRDWAKAESNLREALLIFQEQDAPDRSQVEADLAACLESRRNS